MSTPQMFSTVSRHGYPVNILVESRLAIFIGIFLYFPRPDFSLSLIEAEREGGSARWKNSEWQTLVFIFHVTDGRTMLMLRESLVNLLCRVICLSLSFSVSPPPRKALLKFIRIVSNGRRGEMREIGIKANLIPYERSSTATLAVKAHVNRVIVHLREHARADR